MDTTTLIRTYFQALVNIFIFLPYYFSVDSMVRTLFAPWKLIVSKKERRGFSFSDWGEDLMFAGISRGIGFTMRSGMLLTYLMIQVLYLPVALVVTCIFFVIGLPIALVVQSIGKSADEQFMDEKKKFVFAHTLDVAHQPTVEAWFDMTHQSMARARRWWELENLMSVPPMGRDWTQGYTPTLDRYCTDLSSDAMHFHSRPMTIGREREMVQIEDILCKSQDANLLLTGESGVGKTTVVESLAYRIYIGRGNPLLSFKRLLDLNLEKILSEATDMKVREQILSNLLKEAYDATNIIIVINNIDRYVSSGEGRLDLSIPLEKFLQQPRVQVIGVCTPIAFQRYIYPRTSLVKHFSIMNLTEISADIALRILLEHNHRFETRYDISIPYETLVATVTKSAYFITTIPFPEKALQLLDDACVYVKNDLKEHVVTPEVVDHVLSEKTHVPTAFDQGLKDKLLHVEELLDTQVIGQKQATYQLSTALQRAFIMLGKRKKPLATFLLLGPTGVGKTESAKALAHHFFDSDDAIIRFDMSQYQQVSDIPKLIGDQESGTPGLLISSIRQKPYGILLLDEIEKASSDLLNIFLTVLDEGYITDSTGLKIDCKSLMIIATSNAGAVEFYQLQATSYKLPEQQVSTESRSLQLAAGGSGNLMQFLIENRYFSPEFLNRFDGVIAYETIDATKAFEIGTQMLGVVSQDILNLHGIKLVVSDTTLATIIHKHFNPAYGVRDLQRGIREEVETTVAHLLLENTAKSGDTISM